MYTPFCLSRLLQISSHAGVQNHDGQKIAPVLQRIHQPFYKDIRINANCIFYFNYDQLNTVDYSLLEKQMYSEAIDIFKLNIEEYSDVFWIYDSLAEAYEKSGQKEKAIEYYSKTLELNPLFIHAKKKIIELNNTKNERV